MTSTSQEDLVTVNANGPSFIPVPMTSSLSQQGDPISPDEVCVGSGCPGHYHQYRVVSSICDSARQFGCSASYVFSEGLDRYPAPGLDGSYVHNNEVRSLPIFGDTRFIVDPSKLQIINVTQPGHLLFPGYVVRQVFTVGTEVFIGTYGVGNGAYDVLNVAGANVLWHSVDAQIAQSLTGLFPPTTIAHEYQAAGSVGMVFASHPFGPYRRDAAV